MSVSRPLIADATGAFVALESIMLTPVDRFRPWLGTEGLEMSGARVTVHMATSLDGYIAREDGRVDWMETRDEFKQERRLDPNMSGRFSMQSTVM